NPNAKKFDRISYLDFIKCELTAMDATAVNLCKENRIPIIAFGLNEENSIVRVVSGDKIGTIIN
ncbi:MAG: UMP kinase, partial [Clostridia bacterium]